MPPENGKMLLKVSEFRFCQMSLRFAERADFLINIELKNSVFRYEGMEEEVIKKSDITDWKSALFFFI